MADTRPRFAPWMAPLIHFDRTGVALMGGTPVVLAEGRPFGSVDDYVSRLSFPSWDAWRARQGGVPMDAEANRG